MAIAFGIVSTPKLHSKKLIHFYPGTPNKNQNSSKQGEILNLAQGLQNQSVFLFPWLILYLRTYMNTFHISNLENELL